MEYISSDTNVWIDYMIIEKLDYPFRLSYTYLMNEDAIYDEILSPKGLKEQLLDLGLKGTELTEEEFYYALKIAEQHTKLSHYDCAALAIAKYRQIVLLTGDAALRKAALSEGVTVMGSIGILDKLFDQRLITNEEYKECLILLTKYNGRKVRLPQLELQKRLEQLEQFKVNR